MAIDEQTEKEMIEFWNEIDLEKIINYFIVDDTEESIDDTEHRRKRL